MRNVNCGTIKREIEEAGSASFLTSAALSHIETCAACETISRQQTKLQTILSSLDSVEAPGDFDFRLRSRLAAQKRMGARVLPFGNLSFGLGSVAVAAMLLLIGSAIVFVSFRTTAPNSTVAGGAPPPKPETTVINPTAANPEVAAAPSDNSSPAGKLQPRRAPRAFDGRREVAGLHSGKRFGTLDQTQTGAQVNHLGQSYPSAAFPINASYQSLKVSVDDSRGASRTISLPSVSFGSQRTLSQTSPLIASARDTW